MDSISGMKNLTCGGWEDDINQHVYDTTPERMVDYYILNITSKMKQTYTSKLALTTCCGSLFCDVLCHEDSVYKEEYC